MRVLVAMSGGVDSSVAALLLAEAGHEVVGATMKLWGGESDSGCCSMADVEDARAVARRIGIRHSVFSFTEEFDRDVVEPYVAAHAAARTPNPCIECNRHIKFAAFLERALRLGFDAVATGHYARILRSAGHGPRLARAVDRAKDQSYVLSMLPSRRLERCLFPIGGMEKATVRARAAEAGLATATKRDSQDVCFIAADGGRAAFLAGRIRLTSGRIVDGETGAHLGAVPALELVTVGQRRDLGLGARTGAGAAPPGRIAPGAMRRYVLGVDMAAREVRVGRGEDLLDASVTLESLSWAESAPQAGERVVVQASAHGAAMAGTWMGNPQRSGGGRACGRILLERPSRRVASGQTVALYEAPGGEIILGSGIATGSAPGFATGSAPGGSVMP